MKVRRYKLNLTAVFLSSKRKWKNSLLLAEVHSQRFIALKYLTPLTGQRDFQTKGQLYHQYWIVALSSILFQSFLGLVNCPFLAKFGFLKLDFFCVIDDNEINKYPYNYSTEGPVHS